MAQLEAQLTGSHPDVIITLAWVSPDAAIALVLTEDVTIENPIAPPVGMTFVLNVERNGHALTFGTYYSVPTLPDVASVQFTVSDATHITGVLL